MADPMKPIVLIAAYDAQRGIGKNGVMPWHIPGEMKFLASTTRSTSSPEACNALIMGRKTYFSIPADRRPLKGRKNYVITSGATIDSSVTKCTSLEAALNLAQNDGEVEKIFIFGGAAVYEEALTKRVPSRLMISAVQGTYACDQFFPEIPKDYVLETSTTANYSETAVHHDTYIRR